MATKKKRRGLGPRVGIDAELPPELPGDFFVLVYDNYMESYTIYIDEGDDGDVPSFALGSNPTVIARQFRLWGHHEIGLESVDRAREFGAAQAIFHNGAVIALFDRTPKVPDVFKEKRNATPYPSY